ncbi:MAG: hypothetical protein HZC36_02405 [Armatimonadetes bacterium]|nr:hypothetical protein [Armatimonadota bacterium]
MGIARDNWGTVSPLDLTETFGLIAVGSKRSAGTWEQLGISQTAEYVDARAPIAAGQPEQREYRAQEIQNSARVGATSAILSVVTVP